MKLLFDLFPVILFFAVFKIAGASPEAAQAFGSQYLSGLVSGGEVTLQQAPILLATAVPSWQPWGRYCGCSPAASRSTTCCGCHW